MIVRKVQNQQTFFDRRQPGDVLVFTSVAGKSQPSLMDYCAEEILANGFPTRQRVAEIVSKVVAQFRQDWQDAPDDDRVPVISVHFDIGVQTAAMTERMPSFAGGHWWLEPELDWDAVDRLQFNPSNPWVQLLLQINEALWGHWEEDFFFLPFLHRSPLDAVNGIRGSAMFTDFYDHPDRVHNLLRWCVDWQLRVEDFIYEQTTPPVEWGLGHMGIQLPNRAVWVNGDPVTMISREMMRQFEQPYTGKLFASTGGGFFHNHTKGLYQVDQVAETPGILVQQFTRDPNCPTVQAVLEQDPAMRETIVAASRQTPIYICGMTASELYRVRDILRQGCFIVEVDCGSQLHLAADILADFGSMQQRL